MSPIARAGRTVSNRSLDHDRPGASTQISAAAASTIQMAAVPGIGVLSSRTKAPASRAPRAAHPSSARTAGESSRAAAGAKARSAPAPNSQARAGVTK